jgi:hypothetical protein
VTSSSLPVGEYPTFLLVLAMATVQRHMAFNNVNGEGL